MSERTLCQIGRIQKKSYILDLSMESADIYTVLGMYDFQFKQVLNKINFDVSISLIIHQKKKKYYISVNEGVFNMKIRNKQKKN